MFKTLAGKAITVTGAGSGIGLATAKVLFARGANLSLADLKDETLKKAVAAIKASAPETSTPSTPQNTILTTPVDIRSSNQVDDWIAKTKKHFGKLDGSANVAGVIGPGFGVTDISGLSNEEWEFILGTNLTGTFFCLRAQLNAIEDGGSVVNTSSTTALEGHEKNGAYSSSKHGVIGLTKSAAKEVGPRGIRVNSIAPGITSTPMVDSFGAVESGKLNVFDRVSLKRVAQPEETGELFAFLLGDNSRYITGCTYRCDGGMLG